MPKIFRMPCTDRRNGTHHYEVSLLRELGHSAPELTDEKIADIWATVSRHEVLFTDQTYGKPEVLLTVMADPRSVWLDITRETDGAVVGAMRLTDVAWGYDAMAHVAVWDGIARGREPLMWAAIDWAMERYHLHRLTSHIPPYQSGTIRMAKRLGFVQEGEMREAIQHKGKWMPLLIFGLLEEDLARAVEAFEPVREAHLAEAV